MPIDPKYVEALKDDANKVALAALFAGCAVTGTLPLLPFIALPLEAAYLLFVPDSPWFKKRSAQKREAEERARRFKYRNSILPTLRPADQNRFRVLERSRAEIEQQDLAHMGDWQRDVLQKLDYLTEQFLEFAAKSIQYRLYLVGLGQSQAQLAGRRLRLPGFGEDSGEIADKFEFARNVPADALIQTVVDFFERQSDQIARDLERERDNDLVEVMRKNAEVIRSSKESVERIGKLLRSVERQLDLVVNTFTLINTQIRTGSPERIVADVEDVVNQSQALAQAMQDFGPIEEAMDRLDRLQIGR